MQKYGFYCLNLDCVSNIALGQQRNIRLDGFSHSLYFSNTIKKENHGTLDQGDSITRTTSKLSVLNLRIYVNRLHVLGFIVFLSKRTRYSENYIYLQISSIRRVFQNNIYFQYQIENMHFEKCCFCYSCRLQLIHVFLSYLVPIFTLHKQNKLSNYKQAYKYFANTSCLLF